MPTNLNASFERRVSRKLSEKCRWKTHCTGCMREVMGILELWAGNCPDRFIPAGVNAIVKACNGRYRKGGRRQYSKAMVEKCLHILCELQILSPKFTADIDGVPRQGRFFNPHDKMTKRHPRVCVFIGGGKTPGTWSNSGVWQPNETSHFPGIVVEESKREGTDRITDEITDMITDMITDEITDERAKRDGPGDGVGYGREDDEPMPSQPVTDTTADVSLVALSDEIVPEPSEPSESVEPPEPPEPGSSTCGHGDDYEEHAEHDEGNTSSVSSSLCSLTHPQNRTVKSHFENCDDAVQLVSDGLYSAPCVEFKPDDPDYRRHQKQQKQEGYEAEYHALCSSVLQAVREIGDTRLVDRRTLAAVVQRTIAINGGRVPPGLFRVMKDFQERGGPIILVRKEPEHEQPKCKWDLSNFNTYREAWQALAGAADVPREVLDKYYDGDAMPNKPAAPWR